MTNKEIKKYSDKLYALSKQLVDLESDNSDGNEALLSSTMESIIKLSKEITLVGGLDAALKVDEIVYDRLSKNSKDLKE